MKRIKFQTLAKLGTCMLLILLLVKVFIGEWVYIPSDSMFPTISAKSLVWNSKITYGALMPQRIVETPVLNLLCLIPAVAKADKKTNWGYHRVWGYSSPQRMDVVIFKWDENETQLYVKRIIGTQYSLKMGSYILIIRLLRKKVNELLLMIILVLSL